MFNVLEKIKFKRNKVRVDNFYTINTLKDSLKRICFDNVKNKTNVRIAFVDDEGYDIESVKKLGYINVDKIYRFTDLKQFELYDVIFCDINGVAKDLDSEYQGASLAALIKETYPDKYVVIFSSKNQNIKITKFMDMVDDMIEKNTRPVDVARIIDKFISRNNDPIEFWYNLQNSMQKKGVSNKEISLLEHYYVYSLIDGKDHIKELNSSNRSDIDLSLLVPFIKILIEFIPSLIGGKNV